MAKKIHLDLDKVTELAAKGCTEQEIADYFGVCRDTIARRKRESSTFNTAYRAGRNSGMVEVKATLYKMATDPDKPNVIAAKTYLERYAGPAKVEIQGSLDVNNTHSLDQALATLAKAKIDVDSL